MDSPKSMEMSWKEMIHEMLVKIFSALHVLDLVFKISRVCPSWALACSDKSLWGTLDLTSLGNYFSIPQIPLAWSDENSSNLLRRILTAAFDLSRGEIKKLIFNFYTFVTDEHLILAAERCPSLKQLVLSPSSRLTIGALERALIEWRSSLESIVILCIGSIDQAAALVELIGETCLALKELKIACPLTMEMATCLVTHLPSLKILSLRGAIMDKDALEFLLDNMVNLEVLNITHSLAIHTCPSCRVALFPDLTDEIMQKASRLLEFYTCDKLTCDTCNQKYSNLARALFEIDWYWFHELGEEFWRADEIKSLAY